MARKRQFQLQQFPSHVTARSRDREWFHLPMIDIWDIFCRYLYITTLSYGIRIHSFVLMSNHFHMLVSTPNENLDPAMTFLLQEVSKAIQHESNRPDSIFEGPHHSTAIKNRLYYEHAYKYVYRNPVEARLCARVETYPYSTLRGLMGFERLPFPAFDNMNLITHPGEKLSWLNSPFPEAQFLEDIRQAMKGKEFKFKTDDRDRQLDIFQNLKPVSHASYH